MADRAVPGKIGHVAAPTPTANHLQALARTRLAEAQSLRQAGFYDGCWYLAGYAVECALKAVVCRSLGLVEYPDKVFKGSLKSHVLVELVVLAGLTQDLAQKRLAPSFDQNWDLVSTWDPQDRYQTRVLQQQVEAVLDALTNEKDGVFLWLSNQW